MRKPIRGSTATYKKGEGLVTDVLALAKIYQRVANIPMHLGWIKACEISYLCKYLLAANRLAKRPKRKKAK